MTIEQAEAAVKLIGDFIGSVGLPVALVVMAVAGVFLAGRFLGPIIRAHSEKHLEFVDSVKESNTKTTGILEAIASAIAEQAKALGIISEHVMKEPEKPTRGRK